MNNISFTSTIKPVTYDEMKTVKSRLEPRKMGSRYSETMEGNYVENNLYDTYVSVSNGKLTATSLIDSKKYKRCDMQKLGEQQADWYYNLYMLDDTDTHAVIIGSKNNAKSKYNSEGCFQLLQDMMDVYGKSTTILRGNRDLKGTDIAFDKKKDTYYVANSISDKLIKKGIDSNTVLNKMYDEVVISSKDRVE